MPIDASEVEQYAYELPPELIAQAPPPERAAGRLMHVAPAGRPHDLYIPDLLDLLDSRDLVIVNDTRVVPARLHGRKATGGRVEMLLERLTGERTARVQLRASRTPCVGAALEFEGGVAATVTGRDGVFFELEFDGPVDDILRRHGHMPLPPYIERADDRTDRERYQTVFARAPGAVAAPTAGLHFDRRQLDRIIAKGVGLETVTLHVGAGTFAPLRAEQLDSGRLHAERVEVPARVAEAVTRTRARGGRVVAIGTTTVRALESAALESARSAGAPLAKYSGETTLFIRPGFRFRVVDALLTNFHLPGSSLLMLVCAFAGTRPILAAYEHAVLRRYRFFSYGDAMFCHRRSDRAG